MAFEAAITNLGKYNEGELDFVWVEFPATASETDRALRDVGIGDLDAFGIPYEEMFISDYSCDDGYDLYKALGEYPSIDELNEAAEIIEELNDLDIDGLREYCVEHEVDWEEDELDSALPVDDEMVMEMIRDVLADDGLSGLIRFLAPCAKAGVCEYVYIDGYGHLSPIEKIDRTLAHLRNEVFLSAVGSE